MRTPLMNVTLGRFGFSSAERDRPPDCCTDHFDEVQSYGAVPIHVLLHNEGRRSEILHLLARLGVAEPPEIDHAQWGDVPRGAASKET